MLGFIFEKKIFTSHQAHLHVTLAIFFFLRIVTLAIGATTRSFSEMVERKKEK
jgi:galactitol-specific phosphotransferase system IIC component